MRTVDVSSDDDDDDDVADDTNGGDGVQQSQVSSSEPGPSILASNVIGPLLLEVPLSSATLAPRWTCGCRQGCKPITKGWEKNAPFLPLEVFSFTFIIYFSPSLLPLFPFLFPP